MSSQHGQLDLNVADEGQEALNLGHQLLGDLAKVVPVRKRCGGCQLVKDAYAFHKSKKRADGLQVCPGSGHPQDHSPFGIAFTTLERYLAIPHHTIAPQPFIKYLVSGAVDI
jgi:hypothetical protein